MINCQQLFRLPEPRPGQPAGLWPYVIPPLTQHLLTPLLRRIGATWDVRWTGLDHLRAVSNTGSWILASWHEALLMNIYSVRDNDMVAVVSPSWEGEIIAAAMRGLGFDLARGSSGHQQIQAIRESVRTLKQGRTIGWVVDGPIGPRREVKPGIVQIASLAKRPILPMHAIAHSGWRLATWDKQFIPLPATRIAVGFGTPIHVPPRVRGEQLDTICEQLAHGLGVLEKDLFARLEDRP
ncbi:DUF374 domain-containing protein [bacterium]|nr:DUF374 domain-containing protein [bacterium]